jgi:hypothetical protein
MPLPRTEEEEAPTSTTRSHVNYAPSAIFLAPLPWRKRISARGVSRFQSVTLLLFCFILFSLASFYQKYKKNSPFIVVVFACLLFSLARMSNPEVEVHSFKQQEGESFCWKRAKIYVCSQGVCAKTATCF